VTGERRQHNEKLTDLYSLPNIVKGKGKAIPLQAWTGPEGSKNEMGGAYSTYGRGEVRTEFWLGNLRERDHFEDLGLRGWIILKWIFRKCDGGVDWIDLAHDKWGLF
jgi:hypothetical protein